MKDDLEKILRIKHGFKPMEDEAKRIFASENVPVAIHTTCGSTKMRLEEKLHTLAALCAEKVIVPENVSCCGWAGNSGITYQSPVYLVDKTTGNEKRISQKKHEKIIFYPKNSRDSKIIVTFTVRKPFHYGKPICHIFVS